MTKIGDPPLPPPMPGQPPPPPPVNAVLPRAAASLKALWTRLHNNPWFVAFSALLGTTVYAQLQSWIAGGTFNESPRYWVKTVVAAAMAAAASVYHLKLQPQNPTMEAKFPPSNTPVEVPAHLEPIDPKAVPTDPQK